MSTTSRARLSARSRRPGRTPSRHGTRTVEPWLSVREDRDAGGTGVFLESLLAYTRWTATPDHVDYRAIGVVATGEQPPTNPLFDSRGGVAAGPRCSPDGRWLAYSSRESGAGEPAPLFDLRMIGPTGIERYATSYFNAQPWHVFPDGQHFLLGRGADSGDARERVRAANNA